MSRTRSYLSILLAVLALLLVACGGASQPEPAPAPTEAPATEAEEEPTAEPVAEEEPTEEPAAEEEPTEEPAAEEAESSGFTPSSPECIAPAGPGGGWDFTCRSVTKVMSDIGLVDGTIKVTNMEGGGGGVAFANVVTERNDDDNLIVAASPATTLRIAQGQYGDFDASNVRWLGAVGADFAVLAVGKDSPYESLDDLMAAIEADPNSINFGGGSAVGGQDHMKVMVLAQGAGMDPLSVKYTPFDGGGEALTALLGGFIDVFPGDASEVIGQVEAGEVRILATLTPERLAAPFDSAPTAKELGYDAEWVVFRGFYVPGDMSEEAYEWWASALEQMAASDEWAEARAQGGLEEFFVGGEEFDTFINEQVANFKQLSIDLGLIEGQKSESSSSGDAMASDFTPSSPECIAPAGPGGGWDFTCRSVTKVMSDIGLVDGTIKVTNMEGGGGGVAFANVVTERNDDDNLIVAASPATTLRIAQGQYGDFDASNVRWLGAVGADFAVLAVGKDSPYESLDDLMAAIEADAGSINFGGGSAVGGQDHMKVMVLAQGAGMDPLSVKYTPFDGGGEALTALLGGFIDVFPGDASEVIGQVEAGEVRILATLTPERLAAPFDSAPTAKELGYDAEWVVFRGFYVPADMSEEAYQWWTSALEQMASSDEWAEARTQGGLEEFFVAGDEFDTFINDQITNFNQLSIDLGLIEGEKSESSSSGDAMASDFTPNSPECIAPAGPGGGWDFTCRSVTKVMSDIGLVDGTIKVTNMEGGGGGVAFANVVTERNDDDNLIVAASPATTLRIAQGQYGDFDASNVRWLGAVGADFAVLAVGKDSPYESLDDLMAAIEADAGSINFGGGSAVGGQDHMKVMVLAQGAGLDPLSVKYTPFDGGGEALTALLGGFIDVFPGDASEVIGQVEAGEVRILATLTPERLAAPFDSAPTAKELGYDAEWVVFRGFYVPADMSEEAYQWWVSALEQMAASDEWAEARTQGGLEEFFVAGDEFDTFINEQVANFKQLSIDLGLIEGEKSEAAAGGDAMASDFTPSSPECIAPAGPGGGWDFTCRSVTKVMSDIGLVDGTIKVTNMEGGGGGVAFANVVTERNDDDNLIVAASPATTLRIAQGQYGDFDASNVRWLGAVGADFAVLAVGKDSPYESLDDLMAAIEADAASINFGGGSAVGGQDHMKVMVLAQGAGLDPLSVKYTPFDGGGEALTALLGGFIDVFPGDASEVIGQVEAGEVRILATLTPERLAAPFDSAPTAKELGYDAEWVVFRGFYVPGDMSDDAYTWWASALEQMATSDEWAEARTQGGLEEFFVGGEEFDTFINEQVENFRQLSIDLGLIEG